MPGFTAWFGVNEIGKPKPGETFVVSAASGAVGGVAGQLAKAAGCRVVGIAGGREKCDYVVRELGFDACVDHKGGNLPAELAAACPKGVDVYFDNVGGWILDALLAAMAPFSRIIICGTIADHGAAEPFGHRRLRSILVNRIRMQGMLVFDYKERYPEALAALRTLVDGGKIKYRESVAHGIDNAPRAFVDLLEGRNFGKQLVKLA
jgi:NADPH-dependent curcumin reductase CurA